MLADEGNGYFRRQNLHAGAIAHKHGIHLKIDDDLNLEDAAAVIRILADELLRLLMAYNLSSTHQMRWIEADNDYTTQVLYRYGFQWSTTARNCVHRFVDTIIAFDYFNS